MFLTEANVLYYLLERQYGDADTAVSGGFSVLPLTRRNRNLHVTFGKREYLVKQAKGWHSSARGSVEREAAFYRQQVERWPYLLPRCYSYDPPNSILVFEFLSGHTDLYDAPDRFAPETGRLCGEVMGNFHREMASGEMASVFAGSIPWSLSMHEALDQTTEASEGQNELIRLVKTYPEFARGLDRLRAEWREDTVTHGDWKLENCLIGADRSRLRVIDWEFVSWGDSIWDVSALLQSYWNLWIRWPGEFAIEAIQPALRAFLSAYAESRGWEPAEFAARAIRFAGARMLQTAFETLEEGEEITSEAVRLMQGSLHVFTRPEWAAEQLIGAPFERTGARCTTN